MIQTIRKIDKRQSKGILVVSVSEEESKSNPSIMRPAKPSTLDLLKDVDEYMEPLNDKIQAHSLRARESKLYQTSSRALP